MLLLLTLALLGSRPCWAARHYGLGGGTYFRTSENFDGEITGLRVFIGAVNNIKSIQVKFGDSWDDRHGASGGKGQELLLWPGEYITEIHGSFDLLIHFLSVCTDMRGCISFGKSVGKQFSAFPSQQGQVLTGIFGQYGLLGLKGIGFTWDFPTVEATTATDDGDVDGNGDDDDDDDDPDDHEDDDEALIWQ
ncbi:pancreatic adenocarcinoma up-regulated factor [Eulemur rufifrons]|uniref:pancreatic adenocarcinoma up-regulated factor n=1 Tax=Eulemur rufifrons TaxID=859984 RepID=UPI003742F50C